MLRTLGMWKVLHICGGRRDAACRGGDSAAFCNIPKKSFKNYPGYRLLRWWFLRNFVQLILPENGGLDTPREKPTGAHLYSSCKHQGKKQVYKFHDHKTD